MEQGELFIPINFQGKKTSSGNLTSQRVSLETHPNFSGNCQKVVSKKHYITVHNLKR